MPNAIGTAAIGPNFANELAAAGLAGLPFTWGADGVIQFGPAMTETQEAAVNAVYATHNPNKAAPVATYDAAIKGGLTITSTGTPALNGIYAADPDSCDKITALQTAINTNAALWIGYLRNAAGTKITMTAAQFTAIATAILAFVAACDDALATGLAGGSPTWPAPTATIA